MRNELLGLQRSIGITTVYVTHDQTEAFAMSDLIAVMNEGAFVQVGTPKEIYVSPTSEFVVRFLGESNSFDCTITSADSSMLLLTTTDGLVVRAARRDASLVAGESVRLHFREEQVRLSRKPEDEGANWFECEIAEVQYLGALLTYVLRLTRERTIRITTGNTQANLFAIGERLYAHVDPNDCVVLAHETTPLIEQEKGDERS